MAKLGLILGDQLNRDHAVLTALDAGCDRLVMGEVMDEVRYVPHHVQKVLLIFAAMRHHAAWLRDQGWTLSYHAFDAASSVGSFTDLVARELEAGDITEVVVSWPGEWRVLNEIERWAEKLKVTVTLLPDQRFVGSLEAFNDWAEGRKQLRMEYFYRQMRKHTGLLMEGDEPVGGAWNFDADNRKGWPAKNAPEVPAVRGFADDPIVAEVRARLGPELGLFGEADGFDYPVTAEQAALALADFIAHRLPRFGDYQDALADEAQADNAVFLFHSRLSSSLNLGLLSPLQVCQAAEQAWHEGAAPLNAVEGFIRQVIGWREYVRGIYWHLMPEYAERNSLGHDQPLPSWYWSGKVGMRCLQQAIQSTRQHAYAHHIQRLMVTGNFALLLGIEPKAISEWYLAVYIDAYEWVELPNVLGMVMHADDGVLASKPYAASGKYIQRMGGHCKHCRYQVSETVGEQACPFNALYWDFLERHRASLAGNPRMGMMYKNLDRMDEPKRIAIRERADWLREHIEQL